MLDSDADRLAMIQGLGGQLVRFDGGQFWAIFDNEYYGAELGSGPPVESAQPVLTARTIDIGMLTKDTPLEFSGETYLFRRHEPDGTGLSRIYLRR